eukprot:14146366-Alexandrium_andersonii.AAC.1
MGLRSASAHTHFRARFCTCVHMLGCTRLCARVRMPVTGGLHTSMPRCVGGMPANVDKRRKSPVNGPPKGHMRAMASVCTRTGDVDGWVHAHVVLACHGPFVTVGRHAS